MRQERRSGKPDKPATETKPATYDGTWSATHGSSLHVQQIVMFEH
jgi:hypothetical protein